MRLPATHGLVTAYLHRLHIYTLSQSHFPTSHQYWGHQGGSVLTWGISIFPILLGNCANVFGWPCDDCAAPEVCIEATGVRPDDRFHGLFARTVFDATLKALGVPSFLWNRDKKPTFSSVSRLEVFILYEVIKHWTKIDKLGVYKIYMAWDPENVPPADVETRHCDPFSTDLGFYGIGRNHRGNRFKISKLKLHRQRSCIGRLLSNKPIFRKHLPAWRADNNRSGHRKSLWPLVFI